MFIYFAPAHKVGVWLLMVTNSLFHTKPPWVEMFTLKSEVQHQVGMLFSIVVFVRPLM